MEPKSESLADKTLDEKATQKPEPRLEAASLLGQIFTLMKKKREQDIRYSQQEQLQQSQSQVKELETRIKILEAIKGPKDESKVEGGKPGKELKPKKEPKQKKSKKSFGYPDGFAGFLVDATIVSGLILKYNKESEETQKQVDELDSLLDSLDYEELQRKFGEQEGAGQKDLTKPPEPEKPAAAPVEPVKPVEPPAAPAKPVEPVTKIPKEQAKPSAEKQPSGKKPSKEEDALAQRARGYSAEFGKLGVTNPIAIQAALQVAGKESGINKVSEYGAKSWANNVQKNGPDYANGIFGKNFTKEQYLEAAAKGDEYFFGPNFMSQYSGGWKYRGRGLFGLTHDYNYKKVGELIGEDIYSNPDLVNRDVETNAKASLAVLALSLGRGNYKKGIEILNNFKDKTEALKFITANIAAGNTGLNENAKVFDKKSFKMNLEKAEKFESSVSAALANASPAQIPKSTGGAIDSTSTQNSAAKADAKATQSSVTNNYSNQSQQNKKSSPQDKKVDDRPAYTKKANQ